MEIISRIKKQLTRSQQGWVDDLPQVLWIHRTLPRNNQNETLYSLTYGSKAIIPTVENNVAKDDRGRTKEVTKRKESKEVALIEEAYYQNKLCSLEDVMKQVATLHLKIDKKVKDLRPCMSLRLMKRIKESNLKSSRSSNMIMFPMEAYLQSWHKIFAYIIDSLRPHLSLRFIKRKILLINDKGVRLKSPKVMAREIRDIIDKT
ncbi:reverse transcriptase domain-containing protein [Tanacetum coccineum]